MNQLFTFSYWLNTIPGANFQFSKITLGVSVAILIAGGALWFYRKKMGKSRHKKWVRTYSVRLINLGILALGLLFVREVGIPFLSMRLWWLVWLIFLFLFSFLALKSYRKVKNRPVVVKSKKTDPRAKYLPKKKKRK